MKNLLTYIVKHIVDNPERVSIEEETQDRSVLYKIRADQKDVGKIIGKGGKTIKAIRMLTGAIPAPDRKRRRVEIIE